MGDSFLPDVGKISKGNNGLFSGFDVQMRQGSQDNGSGRSREIKPLSIVTLPIEVVTNLVEKGLIGAGYFIAVLSKGKAILISREDSDAGGMRADLNLKN